MPSKITGIRSEVVQELEEVKKQHRGKLHPKDVVDFARNPKTALHSRFCWDDTEAAKKYRLQQAQEIIRAVVTIIPDKSGTSHTVRAYVSLSSDRHKGNGFYRSTVHVLSDSDLKNQLLQDARKDMEIFIQKYDTLVELQAVTRAMRALI